MICFPVSTFLFAGFVYLVSADYNVNNDNIDGYGAAQMQPVRVQQVPYYGKPDYNQPMYANVRSGRHHGAFFDITIKNHRHKKHSRKSRWASSSGSDEYRRGYYHGNHHGYYPSAPGWPYFGYEQQLSNPFFSPTHRHGRHHHKKHNGRYSRSSSSSSGDRSD